MNKSNIKMIARTALVGLVGAILFKLIHIPVPYLLGPMIAILLANRIFHFDMYWPKQIQSAGLIVIGYSLGIAFNEEVLKAMLLDIPMMLLVTTFLCAFSCLFAFLISKYGKIDYPTALTSSVPGGLTQIIAFAQDMKGVNLSTVTFFHTIRVIMIVILVPFIVHLPFLQPSSKAKSTDMHTVLGTLSWSHFLIYMVLCTIAALIGRKIKLPAAYLLGPLIITVLCNLTFIRASSMPPGLLNISQFVVGIHIGLLLHPESLKNKKQQLFFAFLSSIILIFIAFVLSIVIMKYLEHTSIITGFLSLAPGGMDQMGIIGHEVHADVATITIYQLFRILYIYILIPPLLTIVNKRFHRETDNDKD
ncbi:AbrB family transcriptional regulator [Rummeliibacillus suwonensis]|uniref:AbrB family transcriptional regulator n=1 Tax=Rummeliibacillus suwonensis TaxID=1306154 RepID=UPI001FD5CE27|nr:AbrB family transcriptional regulator [Rummeliibacillus suwonensis]